MSWFVGQNFSLASARNKFLVLFEREGFNDSSAEFLNYLSKFFFLNAARNKRITRKQNAQFSIAFLKRPYFRKSDFLEFIFFKRPIVNVSQHATFEEFQKNDQIQCKSSVKFQKSLSFTQRSKF